MLKHLQLKNTYIIFELLTKTLSHFTLRRIANLKTNGNELTDVIDEMSKLINELGENYLEREKKRMSKTETEIIIAIQNINNKPN